MELWADFWSVLSACRPENEVSFIALKSVNQLI
jgi:hypothetical protein